MSEKVLSELRDLDSLISEQEREQADAVYAAKLHSVLQLQRRAKPDEAIEQRLGIRLHLEHRHQYTAGNSVDFQLSINWLTPPTFGALTEGVTYGRAGIFLTQNAVGSVGDYWEFDALKLLGWLAEHWATLLLVEESPDPRGIEFDTSKGGINFVDAFHKAPVSKFMLLRQGSLMRVLLENTEIFVPFDSVRSTLETIGDVITRRIQWLRRIGAISKDIDKLAEHWQYRNIQPAASVVHIATRQDSSKFVSDWLTTRLTVGLAQAAPSAASEMVGSVQLLPAISRPDQVDIRDLSERPRRLLAAARMLRPQPSDSALEVLRYLDQVEFAGITEELAKLRGRAITAHAQFVARGVGIGKPVYLGYELALWLRNELGLGIDVMCHPDRVLSSLGVHIHEIHWKTSQIDAVACWQALAQPVVFINLNGRHSESEGGRRASLAHELCHILFDAAGAYPLVEVLGGVLPERTEQTARGFQAEFLLPRNTAVNVFARARGVEESIAELTRKFGVSQQLAANQILNGDPPMIQKKEREQLKGLAQRIGKAV
jgi:Zn-dependent peptidase ImmA (M78 family)